MFSFHPYSSPLRTYRREKAPRENEQILQIVREETDLRITFSARADRAAMRDRLMTRAGLLRGELTLWMTLHPEFRHSLLPLPIPDEAPPLIRAMLEAGTRMNVGPFAAVAGAIAQDMAEYAHALLLKNGMPGDVIVENGGDVFLISETERVAALLPDPENRSLVGLRLAASDMPLALCSSSGRIGHSLSFGQGDLATVCAQNAALADAAATAYGNMLKSGDSVPLVLHRAEQDQDRGIKGVFVQCAGRIGIWGGMKLAALPL